MELLVACSAGARDVLVAYPLVGANAARVRQIAEQHKDIQISVLVENEMQVEQWRGAPVSLFIDVNPGMNRTGVPEDRIESILALAQSIVSFGLRFRGLHYYDGHLSKYSMPERCAHAHRGYDQLMRIADALAMIDVLTPAPATPAVAGGPDVQIPEVITAGTPAFPCSLGYRRFAAASFLHRVSPGTVVYCDSTAIAQLPPEYGYRPAAVIATRVVSHPTNGMITCDAGHKTVSADAGVPTCVVLGHPELEPLAPSEEHLPIRVTRTGAVPAVGEVLYLVPRHVCPTVNNFDDALIISGGRLIAVESVSARGRERQQAAGLLSC